MKAHVEQLKAIATDTGRFEQVTDRAFYEIPAYPVVLVWSRPMPLEGINEAADCDFFTALGTYDLFVFGEDPASHDADWRALASACAQAGFRLAELDEATPAAVVEDEVLVTTLTFTRKGSLAL